MSSPTRFEEIEVGQEISGTPHTTHFAEWNRYAAVNDEFVPIHMDDDAGCAAGNEGGAFGMGNLRLAYVVHMLSDWAGERADLRELSVEYRGLNQKNDVLTGRATVVAKERVGDEGHVRLAVDVVDQNGASTTPGEATVVFAVSKG